MKTVLIICGTGVATSTLVATKVSEHLKAQGIAATVRQGKVADLVGSQPDADLIVATTDVPDGVDVPVIKGLPFLTGVGADAALDQITEALR